MQILVADEQTRVRSAIRLLLEQQPELNIISEVTSTQELLECVGKSCPDMLLLDWELLRFAPEKLLAKLRTICPNQFVIILSSKPQARRAALEAGANEFVSKNEPPESLRTAIKNYRDFKLKKESNGGK